MEEQIQTSSITAVPFNKMYVFLKFLLLPGVSQRMIAFGFIIVGSVMEVITYWMRVQFLIHYYRS